MTRRSSHNAKPPQNVRPGLPPSCSLPSEARALLQRAAATGSTGSPERARAVDAAITRIQLLYPKHFR